MSLSFQDKVENEHLYRAFQLMSAKNFDAAEQELTQGLGAAEAEKDKILMAVFNSSLGVLFKLKNDFSKAWKFYEKAEKLVPQDLALKLITAQLLIDVFGQYDAAIRRCEKVLATAKDDPALCHQAYITMGLAQLKKGEKAEAIRCLHDAVRTNFAGLISTANIDLRLVEAFVRKKTGLPEAKAYLEKVLAFAQDSQEPVYIEMLMRLLKAFPEGED